MEQESVHFAICPKQGPIMVGVVLNRAGILGHFLSKKWSGFETLSNNRTPKHGSSTPPIMFWTECFMLLLKILKIQHSLSSRRMLIKNYCVLR